MKKLIAIIILVGLVLGAWLYWRSRDAADADVVPPDDTVKVVRGDIVDSVGATGAVASNLDVDIKCQASGEVEKLPFDISQHIKEGDTVMTVDPTLEKQAQQAAQIDVDVAKAKWVQAKDDAQVAEDTLKENTLKANADLASAITQANNAEKAAERQKQLLAQNLGSQADYETAQTAAATAQDNLAAAHVEIEDLQIQKLNADVAAQNVVLAEKAKSSAKVALDQANLQLSYCTVPSPMDGVVSALDVQQGSMVASSISNVGGGTTVMTISDLSHIFVLASVDESDIGKVRVGQDVIITADSYPGVQFKGKVVRIATTGVNTTNVVTFQVKIEVTSKNKDLLKPVMTTNVTIIAAKKQDVLLVPWQALQRQGNNTYYATLLGGAEPTDVPVRVGMTDGQNYEALSGLKEGDTVELNKNLVQSKWDVARFTRRMGNPIVHHH